MAHRHKFTKVTGSAVLLEERQPDGQSEVKGTSFGAWFDALPEQEQQLLANRAADYVERWEDGEDVSLKAYMSELPEHLRAAFKKVVNASALVSVLEDVGDCEPTDHATPANKRW